MVSILLNQGRLLICQHLQIGSMQLILVAFPPRSVFPTSVPGIPNRLFVFPC